MAIRKRIHFQIENATFSIQDLRALSLIDEIFLLCQCQLNQCY